MKKNKAMFICLIMAVAIFLNGSGCTAAKADSLMKNITAAKVSGKEIDETFLKGYSDFSVKLFQKSMDKETSSLISPLSVMLALSMTINGAEGETRSQMEQALGGLSVAELNDYLCYYLNTVKTQQDNPLKIADSIWFRNKGFVPNQAFLQTNADYYNGELYSSPFDQSTAGDINRWVKDKTDGRIDKIVEELSSDTVMCLINALSFDAKWQKEYESSQVKSGVFTTEKGEKRQVKLMDSKEEAYISCAGAAGFEKQYNNGYKFVALLPGKGISIKEYVSSLKGEMLEKALSRSESADVYVKLAKFKYAYSLSLNDPLKQLGMPLAFDEQKADFSKLGHASQNIYINQVIHKTEIELNENGTKASATSIVGVADSAAAVEKPVYHITLDRPFVYVIVDTLTNMPIFMGTVMDIK